MASDEDLKLSDTLRYYMRDSNAAKNLLYRRRRCLANYETANKNLDKARAKNREVGAVSAKKYVIYFYLGNNNTIDKTAMIVGLGHLCYWSSFKMAFALKIKFYINSLFTFLRMLRHDILYTDYGCFGCKFFIPF